MFDNNETVQPGAHLEADVMWQTAIACSEINGISRTTRTPLPLPNRYAKPSQRT